jgi:pantoate--beta-alanine ligase
MEIYKTISALRERLDELQGGGKTIGFVPTMGALHEGHLSLVRCSKRKTHITVVSIFVNPTQFNDPKDLERYPRTLEKDIDLLEKENCDILFAPDDKEMYPEPDNRVFDFGYLDKILEGKYRPGHFNGVAQIVSKLFDAVKPDKAFFGQKDYQQFLIVKELTAKYMPHLNLEIIPCPIVREPDGLAMSSRNMLLNDDERKDAVLISQALFKAKEMIKNYSLDEIKKFVVDYINSGKNMQLEYFEIADAETLLPVKTKFEAKKLVGLVAAYCGKIRLIDNIFLT